MSDGSGAPSSKNTTSSGDKTCCPAQVQKTCHVESLKITVHPKKRDGAPEKSNAMVKGQMVAQRKPGDPEPPVPYSEKQKDLTATLKNNRIAAPAEDLVAKEQFKKEVGDGLSAARQATRDAYAQSKQAAQQVYQNRSVKGVQGPTGPTADQKTAMGKVAGAQYNVTAAWLQKAWDREAFELLQRYDLILETVAGFYPDTDAAYKAGNPRVVSTVDIRIEPVTQGKCPENTHNFVTLQANKNTGVQFIRSSPPPIGYSADNYKLQAASFPKNTPKIELVDIMAPTIGQDTRAVSNPLVAIVKLLLMGYEVLKPLDLEVALHTCGKQTNHTVDPAQLNALIRIYRETSFAIGIKIPPFKKKEYEEKRVLPFGKVIDEATTLSKKGSVWNPKSPTTVTTAEGSKTKPTEFSIYFKLNDVEINVSEIKDMVLNKPDEAGNGTRGKLVYDDKDKNQVAAVQQAGRAIGDTAKAGAHYASTGAALTAESVKMGVGFGDLNSLAGVGRGVGGAIDGFRFGLLMTFKAIYRAWQAADLISGILEFMKKFPQCGYKLTAEYSFLEGVFEASVANAPGSNFKALSPVLKAAEDRYLCVGWKGKLSAGFTLMAGKVEASFGILIDFSIVGRAEARVVGQVAGAIEVKGFETEFQRGEDTTINAIVAGKLSGRLFAVAAVESWIYTTKREIGIEAGLAAEGGFKSKFTEKGFELEATVKLWRLPVQWYFIAVNSRTGVADGKVHVLCEQKLWWECTGKIV